VFGSLSRAEEITSEVRRLVLTCRAMEAQLQQSVPKKTHEEVISKMQATIDELDGELNRIRDEFQNTKGITETINALGAQLSVQKEVLDVQGQLLANQTQIIEAQNRTIESLNQKLSLDTVPATMYNEALSKANAAEDRVSQLVPKADYEALQCKVSELNQALATMVPKSELEVLTLQLSTEYVPKATFDETVTALSNSVPKDELLALQTKLLEVEAKFSALVPREELERAETKITELESKLPESVPNTVHEGLNLPVAQSDFAPIETSATVSSPIEAIVESNLVESPLVEEIAPVGTPDAPLENEVQLEASPQVEVVPAADSAPELTMPVRSASNPEQVEALVETVAAVEQSPIQMTLEEVNAIPVDTPVTVVEPEEHLADAHTIAEGIAAPEITSSPEVLPVEIQPANMESVTTSEVPVQAEITQIIETSSVQDQTNHAAEVTEPTPDIQVAPEASLVQTVSAPEASEVSKTTSETANVVGSIEPQVSSDSEVTVEIAPESSSQVVMEPVPFAPEPESQVIENSIPIVETAPVVTEADAMVETPSTEQVSQVPSDVETIAPVQEAVPAQEQPPTPSEITTVSVTPTVETVTPDIATPMSTVELQQSPSERVIEVATLTPEPTPVAEVPAAVELVATPAMEPTVAEVPVQNEPASTEIQEVQTITEPSPAPETSPPIMDEQTEVSTFVAEPVVEIPVVVESSQTVQVVVSQVEEATPAVAEEAKTEIREVQSQLSELKGAEASGATTFVNPPKVVDYYLGFIFRNTGFCARSGLEFVQDLEQIPLDILQNHLSGGDFETWFKEALSDASSAESIKAIRESGTQGEELRKQILAVIGPKYKP